MAGLAQRSRFARQLNRTPGLAAKARQQEERTQKDIAALEEDIGIIDTAEGIAGRAANAVLNASITQKAFDVISRPNYAMVALVDGLLGGDPAAALENAGREFFSGVGGLKGQKRSFGDLLTEKGVGAGGSLSGLIPQVFSDTGKGIRFKRGGFFDWTARGSLGVGLDIALDPTTYLTLGAGAVAKNSVRAGRHFLTESGEAALRGAFERQMAIRAGKSVAAEKLGSAATFLGGGGKRAAATQAAMAPSEQVAREAMEAARDEVAKMIDSGAKGLADEGGIKMFGRTIVPGRVMSEPARDAWSATVKYLDKSALGSKVVDIGEGINKGLGTLFNRDFLIRANESAKVSKQQYLDRLKFSKTLLRDNVTSIFRGVSKADRTLLTKHIDDPLKHALPEHLRPVADKVQDLMGKMADAELKRNLLDQVRANYIMHAYRDSPRKVKAVLDRIGSDAPMATLRGAQKKRTLATLDRAVAAGLHPIDDAMELVWRRGLKHIDAVEAFDYFDEIKTKFGVLPETLEKSPVGGLLDEMEAIDTAKGADAVRKLSPDGRSEFLRRRFAEADSADDIAKAMDEFAEFSDDFPGASELGVKATPSVHGEHMVEVPGVPELKGVLLPEDVAEDIARFNEHFIAPKEVRGLLHTYDVLNNAFKRAVTSVWPAFHMRNAMSNVIQEFTDIGVQALNPKLHADTVAILSGARRGVLKTKLGEDVSYARLVHEMQSQNVVTDYRSVLEVTDTEPHIRKGVAETVLGAPFAAGAHVGAVIENEARASMYINMRRRGLSAADAAARVKKVLFDYQNISKAERDVFTRLIPFYRWTRKNIALQVGRAVKNPGQLGIQAKLTRQQAADPLSLPKFMRGDIAFQLEADENGNIKTVSGIDFPVTDLNLLFNDRAEEVLRDMGGASATPGGAANVAMAGGVGLVNEAITMMTPLLKIPVEVAADFDFFRRGTITDNSRLRGVGPFVEELSKMPGGRGLTEWLGYKKVTRKDGGTEYHMNPTKTYILLKSYVMARFFGTAERFLQSQDAEILGLLTDPAVLGGLRFNDVNINQATRSLEYEYKDILERRAVAEGKRKRFRRTFTPKTTAR